MSDAGVTRHALLTDVRRSVRYHARRRMFFERWNLFTNAASVIFGSATIYGVLSAGGKELAVGAAAVVTIMSSLNLVIGTTRMARLHEDLARRFIDLEKAIISVDEFTEERETAFARQRLDIEADEPPILRVLDSICHNEMMRALGYPPDDPQYVRIAWWQRIFAHFFDFAAHRITSQGQSAKS